MKPMPVFEPITLPFLKVDTITKFGKFYPRIVVLNAMEKYKEKYLSAEPKRAFGMLEYPEDVQVADLDLTKISHKILDLWIEETSSCYENTCWAKIELLNTPRGIEALKTMDDLRLTPLAVGATKDCGDYLLVSDYELISLSLFRKE